MNKKMFAIILIGIFTVFSLYSATAFACSGTGCYKGPIVRENIRQPTVNIKSSIGYSGCGSSCLPAFSSASTMNVKLSLVGISGYSSGFKSSDLGKIGGNLNVAGGLSSFHSAFGSSDIGNLGGNLNVVSDLSNFHSGFASSSIGNLGGNLNIGIRNPFCDP